MNHRFGTVLQRILAFDRDIVKFAIQSFVIRVDRRTVLVDMCIGEQKDRPEIPAWNQRRAMGFLEQLAKTGVDPADVDTVFCTHLDVDHVGWNTRREGGRRAPTFPNARYLIGRKELDDWMAQREAKPEAQRPYTSRRFRTACFLWSKLAWSISWKTVMTSRRA
jgi:glyoxylase-like metal-dependent hydrolase (beta-lactamase superfamily II)